MPGTTTCAGLPYPTDTDPIDVAGDIAKLALAADTAVCKAGVGNAVGILSAYWDAQPAQPPPRGMLRCVGGTFDQSTYPDLFAFLGSNALPDFRGRFMRGTDAVGGPFPANGQLGGNADAAVAAHTHTVDNHTHSIAHDHNAFTAGGGDHLHGMSHDHAPTGSSANGNHSHNVGNGEILPYKATWNTLGFRVTGNPGDGFWWQYNEMTFLHDGNHTHTTYTPVFSGNTTQTAHSHTIDVPAYGGQSGPTGLTTNTSGEVANQRNLPPFINVTILIQAVAGL